MYTIISIEGNIGSGKSTLLENMRTVYADRKDVVFLREPVTEWETIRDSNGNTILQMFYANQTKYSFPFQMMAYITRLSILRETIRNLTEPHTYIITERTLFTDRHVFAKMLYKRGEIEEVCYQIYLKWFDEFVKEFPISKVIYVKASPKICYDRIHKRNRIGEEIIPLSYLEDCDFHHDLYIENEYDTILTLDGNVDIFVNNNELNNWLDRIKRFIIKGL